jgi:hypothetical protein
MFVGTEGDAKLADWARRLVNRLVRRDIEGRLAATVNPDGLHLTCPVLVCEASIRALAPDAVVALDREASALVHHWSRDERSTVIVELDRELETTAELVSWQIGRSSGRVRARISPRIDASRFSALVHRLCAGPHPAPPTDGLVRESTMVSQPKRSRDGSAARRNCAILTGTIDGPSSARVDGLLDHMSAAGLTVAAMPIDRGIPAGAATASLVVLAGVGDLAAVNDLVEARRESARPTLVDLGPRDLSPADTADAPPSLTADAARLALACGLTTSPEGAVHSALRRLGVRALVVPTMLPRRRAAELKEARGAFDPDAEPVVGWRLGAEGSATAEYRDEAAEGLAKVLANRFDVRVLLLGDGERVPSALRGHDYLVAPEETTPESLATWTVQLWTPNVQGGAVAEDLRAYIEASHAGVPTVMPLSARAAIDGHGSPPLVVQSPGQPEQWAAALRHVIDSPTTRASRAKEARERSDAVDSAAASRTIVNRLMGWAFYQVDR